MNIELPELEELSTKLDRVIGLLERIVGTADRSDGTSDEKDGPVRVGLMCRTMDVKQVAEYLGISMSSIYKMSSARSIPFTKVGSRLLFEVDQIDRWIRENRQQEIGRRRRER